MKSRLVTLLGTGGVGKTRLAVETLLARRGELPRDLVFVSIEMVADPSEGFLSALRDALGLPEVDAPTWPAFTRIYTAATGCCCSTTSSR